MLFTLQSFSPSEKFGAVQKQQQTGENDGENY